MTISFPGWIFRKSYSNWWNTRHTIAIRGGIALVIAIRVRMAKAITRSGGSIDFEVGWDLQIGSKIKAKTGCGEKMVFLLS